MKNGFHFIASLLILAGGHISLAAQEGKTPRASEPAPMQQERIITQYLPQDNKTVVKLRKMRFSRYGYCDPLMLAEFSYDGERPRVPESVWLGFITNGFEGQDLVVVAGGERIDLGRLRPTRFHQGNECRPLIRAVGLEVGREVFLRIANADGAKWMVGGQELPMEEWHFQGLRELGRTMRP